MQTSLWIMFVVIALFLGFLIGYSQPQYEPRPAVTSDSAQTAIQQAANETGRHDPTN